MPGNKYNGNSNHYPGRVERLLRDREQRKSSRAASHLNESADNNNRVAEAFENDPHLRAIKLSCGEQYPNGAAVPRAISEVCERQDERPFIRQRLLVVANRLPVSAVRRGEDYCSLEISAGGLVSALLGKKRLDSHIVYSSFRFSFYLASNRVNY